MESNVFGRDENDFSCESQEKSPKVPTADICICDYWNLHPKTVWYTGILPKVEISVHFNQGDFKFKNENKIQKHKELTTTVFLNGQEKHIIIKFTP